MTSSPRSALRSIRRCRGSARTRRYRRRHASPPRSRPSAPGRGAGRPPPRHHGRTRATTTSGCATRSPEVTALPRGGERLRPRAHRPPGRPAPVDLRQIKAPPARPTSRSPPATAGGYYGRSFEGKEVAPAAARAGRRPRRLDPARPAGDTTPTSQPSPAGVLLDLDTARRGTQFFPVWAAPRSAPPATLLAYSTRSSSATRYTIHVRDLATGERADEDHRGAQRGHLGARRAGSSTRPSTTPGAPTRSGSTGSGTAQSDDALVHQDRQPVLAWAWTRQRPLHRGRERLKTTSGTASSTPTRELGLGSSTSAARGWSTPSTTRSSAAPTPSSLAPQRHRPGLRVPYLARYSPTPPDGGDR